MTKPNVTTKNAARCLEILKAAKKPIVAADLAGRLFLPGRRETKRRHVRAIVKHLRDNGSRVVATLQGGYMLTDDESIWKDYLEGRQIDAKRVLGVTGKQKKIMADVAGQGHLFDLRVRCGCASIGAG